MLYRVVLTFETVNEKLECGNFIKATVQYFFCVIQIDYYATQGGSNS